MTLIEFYHQKRLGMMEAMQASLSKIRQAIGYDVRKFADILGMKRLILEDLEAGNRDMEVVEYLSVIAIVDRALEENDCLVSEVESVLKMNAEDETVFDHLAEVSLRQKWLDSFPYLRDRGEQIVWGTGRDGLSEEECRYIAANCRSFLDKSAVSQGGFLQAIGCLGDELEASGEKFIIPLVEVELLQRAVLMGNREERALAKRGMKNLAALQERNIIEIRGDQMDSGRLSTFLSVFVRFKAMYRLVLFTADESLAREVVKLNDIALGGTDIRLVTCTEDGVLRSWQEDKFDGADEGIAPSLDENKVTPWDDFCSDETQDVERDEDITAARGESDALASAPEERAVADTTAAAATDKTTDTEGADGDGTADVRWEEGKKNVPAGWDYIG